jgi:hypothetical protein
MRYLITFFLFFLIFCFNQIVKPQDFQIECGMPDVYEETEEVLHYVGKHITSSGILRVLVIFVRFADDNETSAIWPNPNVLPEWAANFVNTDYRPAGNYYEGTASHYFYQNSYGNMHVVGEVYYVTTNFNEAYYHQIAAGPPVNPVAARSAIQMEALDKLDIPEYNVNFSNYDNWNRVTDYDIRPGPDGVVDMIWFITRNLRDSNLPSGQAPFGIGWATLDCPTHQRDGVTIKGGGFGGFPASGIGMFKDHMYWSINAENATRGTIVNHVAHEMTHYFFGFGHFATELRTLTSTRTTSSFKTYACGWRGVYSGYEKWRLGWMQPTIISADGDSYTLWDLATTMYHPAKHRLFKINIPGTSQFFLIENRRWISIFEPRYEGHSAPYGKLKPGIVVYHFLNEDDHLPNINVVRIDADGRFIWQMLHHGSNNNSQIDDFIDKDGPDRINGYSESEKIFITGYPNEWWVAEWHPYAPNPYGGGPYICTNSRGGIQEAGDLYGDSLDVFSVGEVISPWSNMPTHKWTGSTFLQTTIGIEVASFSPTSQTYTLKVRLTNAEELPPSKPQDVKVTVNGYLNPVVTWIPNIEPDMPGGQYKI